jgi:hypothetical protein
MLQVMSELSGLVISAWVGSIAPVWLGADVILYDDIITEDAVFDGCDFM